MFRGRTKNRKPRFFRGGKQFGRGWLTLTEPGDPVDQPDVTEAQAKAIRAETRFLEVEEIDKKEAAKILAPQGKGKDTPPSKPKDPPNPPDGTGEGDKEKNPDGNDPESKGGKPEGESSGGAAEKDSPKPTDPQPPNGSGKTTSHNPAGGDAKGKATKKKASKKKASKKKASKK